MEGLVKGDVIVVDYPYTNLAQTKRRPALVIYAVTNTPNLVLCQITSQFKTDPDAILLTADDFAEGGLTQAVSNIRPNYLVTLHQDLVLYRVGRLTTERMEYVTDTLISLLQRED